MVNPDNGLPPKPDHVDGRWHPDDVWTTPPKSPPPGLVDTSPQPPQETPPEDNRDDQEVTEPKAQNKDPFSLPKISSTYSKLPALTTQEIKPKYDGNTKHFFTFLFQLRERRNMCPIWQMATYVKDETMNERHEYIDLLNHFIDQRLDTALPLLAKRWPIGAPSRIYDLGHVQCASNLLFQVLSKSVTVDIRREVAQNLMEYPQLHGDGTAFWLILTKLAFPSSAIFKSSIKNMLRSNDIKQKPDIPPFVTSTMDLLHLLPHDDGSEIIPLLFLKFKSVSRPYFVDAISDLEKEYIMGKHPTMTAMSFLRKVLAIRRVQIQALQWDAQKPEDSTVTALKAVISKQQTAMTDIVGFLSANQQPTPPTNPKPSPKARALPIPPFFKIKPEDLSEKKLWKDSKQSGNPREWRWCDTCHRWSTTHNTAEHKGTNNPRDSKWGFHRSDTYKKKKHKKTPTTSTDNTGLLADISASLKTAQVSFLSAFSAKSGKANTGSKTSSAASPDER